jgi:hypothetical protein
MPLGGDEVQEGREVKVPLRIHRAKDRDPPEALGQIKNH